MTEYNARFEYRTREPVDEQLITELAPYHPATSRSLAGWVEVTITVPAETLRQATTTALAIAGAALDADLLALDILPTTEYDARLGLAPLPEMLSVTEAAERLGVSRQAVLQRLESGSLPGKKLGKTWAVPADAVLSAKERRERLEAGHAEQLAAARAIQQRPRP